MQRAEQVGLQVSVIVLQTLNCLVRCCRLFESRVQMVNVALLATIFEQKHFVSASAPAQGGSTCRKGVHVQYMNQEITSEGVLDPNNPLPMLDGVLGTLEQHYTGA
jgi:hypothetical protein